MNKKELLDRAQELKISVPEGATNAEIENLIKIEEHGLLSDEVKDLTQKLSAAEKELEAAKANQSKLKVEPKAKSGNEELPTYEHDGKTYQFTVKRIVTAGGKITAEEAVEDKDLMAELIKSEFFGLKKV